MANNSTVIILEYIHTPAAGLRMRAALGVWSIVPFNYTAINEFLVPLYFNIGNAILLWLCGETVARSFIECAMAE